MSHPCWIKEKWIARTKQEKDTYDQLKDEITLLKTKLNEENLTVKDLKGIIEAKTSKNKELGVKFNENKNK